MNWWVGYFRNKIPNNGEQSLNLRRCNASESEASASWRCLVVKTNWSWIRLRGFSGCNFHCSIYIRFSALYITEDCLQMSLQLRNYTVCVYIYIQYICMILYKFVSVYACDEFSVFVSHNLKRLILQNCCLLRCKVLQVQKQDVLQHCNRLPG